jgi:hypothetical protein
MTATSRESLRTDMRNILGVLLLLTVSGSASGFFSTARVEILGVSITSTSLSQQQASVRYKMVYPDGRASVCQSNIEVLAASATGVTLRPASANCHAARAV